MKATFKTAMKVKVDKSNGIVQLSISPSDYKVEVFKITIDDMSQLVASYKEQLKVDHIKSSQNGTMVLPVLPIDNKEETKENNNN
jgi:Cu/Ag efflux pump CusA